MSYLMLFATGSMQTQNDKMLLGDMNAAKPTPDQLGQVFPLIVFVLTITFVAPYLEELVYRGILKKHYLNVHDSGYRSSYHHLSLLLSMVFQIG